MLFVKCCMDSYQAEIKKIEVAERLAKRKGWIFRYTPDCIIEYEISSF